MINDNNGLIKSFCSWREEDGYYELELKDGVKYIGRTILEIKMKNKRTFIL